MGGRLQGKSGGLGAAILCLLHASFGGRRTDGQTDMAGVEKRFPSLLHCRVPVSRIPSIYPTPIYMYAPCRLLSTSTIYIHTHTHPHHTIHPTKPVETPIPRDERRAKNKQCTISNLALGDRSYCFFLFFSFVTLGDREGGVDSLYKIFSFRFVSFRFFQCNAIDRYLGNGVGGRGSRIYMCRDGGFSILGRREIFLIFTPFFVFFFPVLLVGLFFAGEWGGWGGWWGGEWEGWVIGGMIGRGGKRRERNG